MKSDAYKKHAKAVATIETLLKKYKEGKIRLTWQARVEMYRAKNHHYISMKVYERRDLCLLENREEKYSTSSGKGICGHLFVALKLKSLRLLMNRVWKRLVKSALKSR